MGMCARTGSVIYTGNLRGAGFIMQERIKLTEKISKKMKEIIQKNNLIRYKILEQLYLANQDGKQLGFESLIQKLDFSKNDINQNMKFLEEEGLIDDYRMVDGNPIAIRITSEGMKLIEEIEILKQNKKGSKVYRDALKRLSINASWIIPSIIGIIKLLSG